MNTSINTPIVLDGKKEPKNEIKVVTVEEFNQVVPCRGRHAEATYRMSTPSTMPYGERPKCHISAHFGENVKARITSQNGTFYVRIEDEDNLPFWIEFEFEDLSAKLLHEYVMAKKSWPNKRKRLL